MQRYILFTQEELEDLMNGGEVEVQLRSGEILYFMRKDHFKQMLKGDM